MNPAIVRFVLVAAAFFALAAIAIDAASAGDVAPTAGGSRSIVAASSMSARP